MNSPKVQLCSSSPLPLLSSADRWYHKHFRASWLQDHAPSVPEQQAHDLDASCRPLFLPTLVKDLKPHFLILRDLFNPKSEVAQSHDAAHKCDLRKFGCNKVGHVWLVHFSENRSRTQRLHKHAEAAYQRNTGERLKATAKLARTAPVRTTDEVIPSNDRDYE